MEDVDAALKKLDDHGDRFHVVVTIFGADVKGPGRHSWWELTKKIRTLPMERRAPLIVANLSLTRHQERRAPCLSNGAFSFISNQSELIKSLTTLFSEGAGVDAAEHPPYQLTEDMAPSAAAACGGGMSAEVGAAQRLARQPPNAVPNDLCSQIAASTADPNSSFSSSESCSAGEQGYLIYWCRRGFGSQCG